MRSRKQPVARVLAASLALAAFICSQAQANQATEDKIRQLIETSEIVPNDYRQHISIVDKSPTVLISVYKAPDAQPSDCKIDAILMTAKVIEAAPSVASVNVFFFDLAAQDKVLEVDVPTSAVQAYGHGQLDRAAILHAVSIVSKPANSLASSYSGQSYKQIVQKLGVLEGPAQELRTLALVRIDELAAKGGDVSELKNKYLHIEDLTRRGDLVTMRHELRALSEKLEALNPTTTSERDAKLQSMSPTGAAPQ